MTRGAFITFEGIDGCGKSTQARLLSERLRAEGYDPLSTYEPGGTSLADALRAIFKSPEHKGMDGITEFLILNAARRDHVIRKILPALEIGRTVLSDRFEDATRAYQVYGRHKGDAAFATLERDAHDTYIGIRPDRTYLCVIDPEIGRARRTNGPPDRLDSEGVAFYRRVHDGYLAIAREEPDRVLAIDASRTIDEIHEEIYADAKRLIDTRLRAA